MSVLFAALYAKKGQGVPRAAAYLEEGVGDGGEKEVDRDQRDDYHHHRKDRESVPATLHI